MKFQVMNALMEAYIEVVEDCHTVEDFINRHFGSVDPVAAGLTVSIVPDDESAPAAPVQAQAATAPVAAAPAPATPQAPVATTLTANAGPATGN